MYEVDAHFHVWELARFSYPWPDSSQPVLFRDFSFRDLTPALDSVGVKHAVFIQAVNNFVEEAEWVLRSGHPALRGVVAGVCLTDHTLLANQLDTLCHYEKFVGVRHIIDLESDPNWLIRDDVIKGLRMVAANDKTLDIPARPHNLHLVSKVAKQVPGLSIVIDHIGKPLLSKSVDVCPQWRSDMEAAASCKNVWCKISGLVTEVDPINNKTSWSVNTFREHVNIVLELFGVDRCILGSDWPVLHITGASYKEVNLLHKSLIQHLSETEQKAVLGSNAARFYDLKNADVYT